MKLFLRTLIVIMALICAGAAFAAKPTPSARIGNGWTSRQACVNANGGRPWCRMQNCAQVSTGPCLNQPKRAIWFYEPPGQK